MKKERSVLWLREFREWMDHASENFVEGTKSIGETLHDEKENYVKRKSSKRNLGESSRYISDSVQASGDESSTNILDSDNSFADISTGLPVNPYFSEVGFLGKSSAVSLADIVRINKKQEHVKSYSQDRVDTFSMQAKSSQPVIYAIQGCHRVVDNVMIPRLSAIDDVSQSPSSCACPGSPPHYQEDILHRRHNLVEEILQLSAESYSVASSDSNTSCSDDDFSESVPEIDKSLNEKYPRSVEGHLSSIELESKDFDQRSESSHVRQNGISYWCSYKMSSMQKLRTLEQFQQSQWNDCPPAAAAHDDEISSLVTQDVDYLEKRKTKRNLKKRVISLVGDNNVVCTTESSLNSADNIDTHGADIENVQVKQFLCPGEIQEVIAKGEMRANTIVAPLIDDAHTFSGYRCSSPRSEEFIESYFNTNVADSSIHETCQCYLFCWVLEPDSKYRER